jgi:hypothetical protein
MAWHFLDFSRNKGQRCLFDGGFFRCRFLNVQTLSSPRLCSGGAFLPDQHDPMPEVLITLAVTVAAYRYTDGPKLQQSLLGSAVRMTI